MTEIRQLNPPPVIAREPRFTNRMLFNYHIQIQRMQNQGSVLIFLLKSRIGDFYKNNGLRIKTIDEKIGRLERLYFEHDDQDKVIYVGKDKDRVPKMLPGMDIRNFNEAMNLLMEEETTIV